MMRRLLWPGGLLWAGVVVLVTAVAGCTHPVGAAGSGATPGPLPAASYRGGETDPAAAGRAALEAYRGMWRAYQQAAGVPDPASPALSRYAGSDALSTLMKGLRALKDQGLKGSGPVRVTPRVTAAAPADAPIRIEITDCLDDSGSRIVRITPGPAYHDKPGGRHRTTATVQRQDDRSWKVTDFAVRAAGTC